MNIFRTKDIDLLHQEVENHSLKRALGVTDIVMMGIGVIIGTGIFVLTGVAAAKFAGPGIMLSFALSSLACIFICLAYSELASSIPAAGSAYTYTYVAGGEFLAWLVGWNLVLEYSVGASAVAGGWSAYFVGILKSAGIELPRAITAVPHDGGIVNLPAVLIVVFITFMLVRGIKESATVNRWLVGVKLAAIFLFLLLAGPKVDVANWSPFLPYGIAGISAGASIIFFAYLGVDSLATAAEETKNPQRDMPVGIILSLLVCTVLYVAVSCVLTGVVPYTELNNAEPVTYALRKLGYNFGSAVIGTGAIAGLTTVCLVMIYAQTRAFFAMSRDGLIPAELCKVHPKYGTPHVITLIVGATVALIAGFTPIGLVAEMCNIGTLFAFTVTTACVLVLRKTNPDMKRPFRCPAVTIVVPLAMLSSLYIMTGLPTATWIRFAVWSLIGLGIYVIYGARNSRVGLRAEGKIPAQDASRRVSTTHDIRRLQFPNRVQGKPAMTEIERRLAALNIVLPVATLPAANYLPYVACGNLLYLSGQLPTKDGRLVCVGKLGGDLTIDEGYAGARLCAINLIVQIKAAIGDLTRVRRIVRLGGFVNSTPSFIDQPKVINGASDLFVEAFGEAGRHARSAVACPSLPFGVGVEVDAIVDVTGRA